MKYIVIDANIARACKDPSDSQVAAQSYAFLMAIRERAGDLGVVINPTLAAEWIKHGNRTFARWWANMESRSRVRRIDHKEFRDYRMAIQAVADDGVKTAMMKDVHLIEIAMEGWHPIASLDEKQRKYVSQISTSYALVGAIQWCNPIIDTGWEPWVRGGCSSDEYRVS
jgi:hypothetical protein